MRYSAVCWMVLLGTALAAAPGPAGADELTGERPEAANRDKQIAKDKQRIANQELDIQTREQMLKQDIARYGSDSSLAQLDRETLQGLRKDLAELKRDAQKDQAKPRAQAGQVPAEELHEGDR